MSSCTNFEIIEEGGNYLCSALAFASQGAAALDGVAVASCAEAAHGSRVAAAVASMRNAILQAHAGTRVLYYGVVQRYMRDTAPLGKSDRSRFRTVAAIDHLQQLIF